MRLSTRKDDAGFALWDSIQHKKIDVFLDGVEQRDVQTADEEAGFVVRCVVHADGHIQTRPDNPDEIWYETVSGAVKIVVSDHA